jgi:hypothetical protein
MNEKEFWQFLDKAYEKGRVPMVSGTLDSPDPEIQARGEYIGGGHSLLPADYQDIPREIIEGMGKLLLEGVSSQKTKEAILVLLAHQESRAALDFLKKYNQDPDHDLRYYAMFALEECEMWNEC